MAMLPKSKVPGRKAGPNGSFPIGDKKHARLAIGGATRSERAGNISPSEADKIKAEARAKLSKGKPEMVANRRVGIIKSSAEEDKGHMPSGKAGHYNYS